MLVICFSVKAQNLVPNPSFEVYDTCPDDFAQIYKASRWFQPTQGTPDYFHNCTINSLLSTPNNIAGYQHPKTGSAYAGLSTFFNSPYNYENYREYIEIRLIEPLESGYKYCVEFNVSLCDSANYATDDIGAYLSIDSIVSDTFINFSYIPQIINNQGNYITDKLNWTLISGEYFANGGEKYITIGNFNNDANTDKIYVLSGSNDYLSDGYYYIDDISVILCDTTDGILDNYSHNNMQIFIHSDGIITVNLQNISDSFISIYNIIGQLILSTKINEKNLSINFNNQANGAYILMVKSQEKVITRNFILNK